MIAAASKSPPHDSLASIKSGGKQSLAAMLSAIEIDPFAEPALSLLDDVYGAGGGHVLGVTGPPGAGKSTLIDVLVRRLRAGAKTVAVLAVDPSSQRTGGALLGDRVRMRTDPNDAGVFVRSIAARTRLGGLARTVFPCVVLLRSLYNVVIVESVGVGQSETEVANVADTVILCVQPGSGDSLQFMKAGILEIPDIAVVTKADMGAASTRALADLKGALSLDANSGDMKHPTACLTASAATGAGIDDLIEAITSHRLSLQTQEPWRRKDKCTAWVEGEIAAEFGSQGLRLARGFLNQNQAEAAPFRAGADLLRRLHIDLRD